MEVPTAGRGRWPCRTIRRSFRALLSQQHAVFCSLFSAPLKKLPLDGAADQ